MNMGRFTLASSLILLFAACGDSDKAAPDAAVVDAMPDAPLPIDASVDAPNPAVLTCLGDPLPEIATDPAVVTVGALSVSATGFDPLVDVQLDANLAADPDGQPIVSGVSDANGQVELSIVTGAVPVSLFLKANAGDTYVPTEVFPPSVIAGNAQLPAPMLEPATIALLANVAGQDANFEEDAIALVFVIDCTGNPITNAVVTPSSGTAVYLGANGIPDSSLTSTSMIGLAVVFNVTPGADLVFDAEVDGQSLRDNTVRAVAGTVLSMGIQP